MLEESSLYSSSVHYYLTNSKQSKRGYKLYFTIGQYFKYLEYYSLSIVMVLKIVTFIR